MRCKVEFFFKVASIVLLTVLVRLSDNLKIGSKQKFLYTFPKLEILNDNPEVINFKVNLVQDSTELHKVSGFVNFSKYADKDLKISFKILKANKYSLNSADFRPTLLALPESNTHEFMNNLYKPYVMKSVSACSNLPQFTGKWSAQRSIVGSYKFNDCALNSKTLPNVFSEGLYCTIMLIKRSEEPKLKAELRVFMQVTKA
ncbi:uncharacterized protein LOC119662641 [Teleopsis dalmanni]|uniref:uncharacterized protein LOC119662641 n=1 Tax=Teleopsis dalmanni TaxID=139649 RepID=UPI0018CE716D|nr:uncharacterized protein LOC119662641 [Teleopsis dalmanni]